MASEEMDEETAAELRSHFAARIGKAAAAPRDALEQLGETIGTLDITNEEVDFREIDMLMSKFQEDPRVQEALQKGMDMREYAKQVDKDLLQVEKDSVGDYIAEGENLAQLHHQIKACDSILERMESLLNGFQADLGNISEEIRYLQDQSSSMSVQLQNRKAVADSLSSFIMDIALEPKLVKSICATDVNESYIEFLTVLNKKIVFSQSLKDKKILASHDVDPELEKLRVKAVTRVREFLLQMIYNLRKPNTNVQILQQNKLLKFKYLYRFLYKYCKEYAVEAREAYVDTLQRIFYGYFREYITGLMRARADIGSKADLLGAAESQMKSFFSSRISKSMNVFSLGDPSRAELLDDLEAPYIVLHELHQSSGSHPYEVLFRSMNHYFKDAVTSEYLFDLEFFGNMDLFHAIFGKSVVLFLDNVTSYLASCFDVIGILLMIRITNHNKQIVKVRKVSCLDDYYQKILSLLWPRYNIIFNLHLESIKTADPKNLGTVGTLPHYITRRYAEFSAAIHSLSTEEDQQITKGLAAMRTEVGRLLHRLAAGHTKAKQRMIFLINNFDHILTIYEGRGVQGEDAEKWRVALDKQVSAFVEDELRLYYADMIQFVRTHQEQLKEEGVEATKKAVSEATVEKLVQNFSSNWKQDIGLIYNNVLKFFPNFMSGAKILQQILTQLALHYTHFEDVVRACYGNKYAKDFVPRPTLTYEIKKYSTNF